MVFYGFRRGQSDSDGVGLVVLCTSGVDRWQTALLLWHGWGREGVGVCYGWGCGCASVEGRLGVTAWQKARLFLPARGWAVF
jgi:hypothetical protein